VPLIETSRKRLRPEFNVGTAPAKSKARRPLIIRTIVKVVAAERLCLILSFFDNNNINVV
jgi:hypothetical protein